MSNPCIHILCVDDEPNILRSLTRFLKMNRFEVSTANGAEEALSLLGSQRFDAVICDMGMPGMTGDELLAVVSRDWPETLRFLLTGFLDMSADDHALKAADLSGFVHKPWNNEELLSLLQTALGRSS